MTSAGGGRVTSGLPSESPPACVMTRLAARWADVVAGTSYVTLPRDALVVFLEGLLEQLAAAARSGDPEAARQVGAGVGERLVDAHFTNPLTVSRTVAVLLDVQPSLSDPQVTSEHGSHSCPLWHHVVGGVAEGFSAALQERALCEQEEILRAAGKAQHEVQLALNESEERFRAVFEGATVGIGVGDLQGRILNVNPALEQILGYPAREFRRRTVADFMHASDVEAVWQLYGELVRGERDHFRLEKQFLRASGESVWTDLTVSLLRDADGSPRYQLALIDDVTALHQMRCQLEFEAHHDPLTGLANRKRFLDLLEQLTATAPAGTRAGLCFLDLDGFKAVNDTLGHEVGDQLLVALARRLEATVRDRGLEMARLGGDEFVVLVAGSQGSAQVTQLAEDLVAAVENPVTLSCGQVTVTASIGVVEGPIAHTDPAELLRAADLALYWAKADGKGRWALYEPDRGARDVARYSLSSALPAALAQGDIRLHYQPLRQLCDGSLHAVEALVRWKHPTLGLLGPERFVGLAEQSGLIVPLGRMVLQMACRQAFLWFGARSGGPFISVNISTHQLQHEGLVPDVSQALDSSGLSATQLQLEITESAVIGTDGRTLAALESLSHMGVRLAIDDFGTGYSNLTYLRNLPIDELKLDGSFLHGLREPDAPDPVDAQLIDSMISLAHLLNLTVTAEGVETVAQLQHLRAAGCDAGQGTLFDAAADSRHMRAARRGGPGRAARRGRRVGRGRRRPAGRDARGRGHGRVGRVGACLAARA